MNEEMRERLSAYLDGALTESERSAVEAQLARSEDLRLELEALRAVSSAVKGLPRQALPPGFMARLEARRTSSEKPERTWVFLPPAARPLAFAMSTAVVALVVWDHTQPKNDYEAPVVGWDGGKVAVKTAAEAPIAQMDLSARLGAAAEAASGGSSNGDTAAPAAPAAPAPARSASVLGAAKLSAFGRRADAPGKPLEFVEEDRPQAQAAYAAKDEAAPVSEPSLLADKKEDSFRARSEEERSAINERLYKNLEREKKRMGIAKIIEKEADDGAVGAVRGAGAIAGMNAPLDEAAPKRKRAPVRLIVLRDADSLITAWEAAGLEGKPPTVNFPREMALFLVCAPGCGIVTVEEGRKTSTVFYRAEGFDNAIDRVLSVPASAQPYVLQIAPPPAR